MKKTILTKSGKILSLIVLTGITLTGISRSEDEGKANAEQGAADEAASDRKKVEFFEKLYKMKIEGVKNLEEYDDPDSFYAAIAKQVGIPKKAFDAVEKKYGWKQNDEFFLSAMVKGGWDGDYWGVMVTKFPAALKVVKSKEEKMKLLEGMEMKMVVIGYDGAVSFPEEPDAAEQDGADQKSAIEIAKAHIQSNLTGEYKKLAETYAPRIMLMPGHEFLKERYGLAEAGARDKGAEVDRDKFIASMEKASGGRPALPKEHADRILGTLRCESVEVEEGDFATAASDPVGTPNGKLHFMIKKDDLLIKVAPPKGDFILLHLRREGDSWKVVSEYLD